MKSVLNCLLCFLITFVFMIASLLVTAVIPKDLIQKKSEESAQQLMRMDTHFYNVIDGSPGRDTPRVGDFSKMDQYADAVSLSMAYYIDPAHPLKSILWANYYNGREDTEHRLDTMNESYALSVKGNTEPNTEYLRYWHGSLILIRTMHVLWNYTEIKTILGITLAVLLAILLFLLLHHGYRAEAICLGVSLFAVSVWFVPISLEYVWMFLLMAVISIFAVRTCISGKSERLGLMMFLSGMLAAYFDFFTTETITLLIPLLLSIRILGRKSSEKKLWILSLNCGLLWGIGYIACWAMKWIFSAVVLHETVIPLIQHYFLYHLGALDEMTALQRIQYSILRNLWPLFPFGYGTIGAVLFALCALAFIYLVLQGKLRLKQSIRKSRILLYALLGVVVYLRYIVLRHHVYYHYFFTYRAQSASILALCFILLEVMELAGRGKSEPGENTPLSLDRQSANESSTDESSGPST